MNISNQIQSASNTLLVRFAAVFVVLLAMLASSAYAAQVKWRVATSAPYSQVRPAVGSDGSVYAVDLYDNLIAVAADGRVLWRVAEAGSKGVDVGPDGTVYTANEDWIKAFNPDGSPKWTFIQNPRAFVLIDVAVGPDGHIYAVASNGMGVLSLADGGQDNPILRWTNSEAFARTFVGYAEIAFGLSSNPGCIQQLYFYANAHTRAVCLEDGRSIFSLGGGNTQPKVSPVDNTWHRGDSAFSPTGVLEWQTDLTVFSGVSQPTLAADGTHYTVVGANELFALDTLGRVRWSTALGEFVGLPDVDPTKSIVIMPTFANATNPLALKAVSAGNGRDVWRVEFPADVSGLAQVISSGVAYSANGDTAYVMTFVNGANKTYLNAVGTERNGVYPELITVEPEPGIVYPAPVEPDPVPVEPDPAPVEPDPAPVEPDPAPAEPDPAPVEPDPAPVAPDPAPVEPDPAPVAPDPVPVEPDPAPVALDPVPVEPDPAPVEPEPAPVEPDPIPVEPEPAPVEPDPVPAEPEPAPVEPDSVPVEPDPIPVEPEPAPVEPDPAPIIFNSPPAPVDSNPLPSDQQPDNGDPELSALATEQPAAQAEADEPVRNLADVVAGSFDATVLAMLIGLLLVTRLRATCRHAERTERN